MEYWYNLHGRFLIRDIRISTPGMSDDADIIVEVDGIHLRKLACTGNGLEDTHCHGNLHITLNGTCCTLFDQHRECRDQHTVKDTCLTLCKSVIMGSNHAEMFVFYPFLECNNVFCHIPYFFDRAAILNIKSIKNILCFCTDHFFICDIVSNRPHFFPIKLFGVQEHSVVQVCLIDVKVHHTRIRSSDLSDIGIAESSSYLCSLAPVFDLCLNSRISTLNYTCNNSMSLACSFQIGNCFTYSTAGISFTKPCSDICVIIIQCFELLNVHKNNRNIKITDCREHIVGCRIGQHLKKYDINVCSTEFISGFHRLLFCCYHSSIDDLYCIRDCFFECLILSFKLRYQ